ncbi:hypothetical protein [Larkinella rosea]|uniref:Uncharacterized protein n=1 Tax=Larkinella rosea TaxID=2025312 RepID=A0A3P1C3H4_9BACT|nr:hypothetical protein [Larkinella rosea]RRB07819.1 hypothetical protein EHT25_08605 [Larkinella rosea]
MKKTFPKWKGFIAIGTGCYFYSFDYQSSSVADLTLALHWMRELLSIGELKTGSGLEPVLVTMFSAVVPTTD